MYSVSVRHRVLVLVGLFVGLAACGDPDRSTSTIPAAEPGAVPGSDAPGGRWDPAALATGERLAATIRAAGIACDGYEVWDYGATAAGYERKLPLPAAITSCSGPGGEDFTFEMFGDEDARDNFRATKLQLVCSRAEQQGLGLFELVYVEGDAWLIEPDEEDTAKRLAEILGAQAKLGSCPPAGSGTAP